MRTYTAKPETFEHKWLVVDLEGKTLGRAATIIASLLRGKHKPEFTPHVDTGDFVVVINADKVVLKGNKALQKLYRHHSGYFGGLKEIPFAQMMERHPERVLTSAVRGMLPKTKLGRKQIKKLKVYCAPEHPHEAQQPQPYEFETI